MQTYNVSPTPYADLSAAALADPATPGSPLGGALGGPLGGPLSRSVRSHPSHERAALASALDDGLMPDEVARILDGRRVAEAFPVRWGESPTAYASRAVSEMFVAYLQ